MDSKYFGIIILVVLALACSVDAHAWMSNPAPRGQYKTPPKYLYEEYGPTGTTPDNQDIVCRRDPVMPRANWVALTAGQDKPITITYQAAHVGDCFVYLSYDGDKAESEMKWFKIWAQHDCYKQANYNIPIPSYLPSGSHVVMRWEWYALHNHPIVEYYVSCVDAVITGVSNGVLPNPQVNIPGHLPAPSATNYYNPYNGGVKFFAGPPVATPDGTPPTNPPSTPAPTPKPTVKPTLSPTSTSSSTSTSTTGITPTAGPGGSVKLTISQGSGSWWLSVSFSGPRVSEINKVEVKDSGSITSFTQMTPDWGGVYSFAPTISAFSAPITIKASLSSGSSLSFTVNTVAGSTIDSGSVFP